MNWLSHNAMSIVLCGILGIGTYMNVKPQKLDWEIGMPSAVLLNDMLWHIVAERPREDKTTGMICFSEDLLDKKIDTCAAKSQILGYRYIYVARNID